MSSKELKDILFEYFYSHPGKEVEEVTNLAVAAKQEASVQVIPQYKPRKIEDLGGVPDEYDVERKKAEAKVYKDESTFGDFE